MQEQQRMIRKYLDLLVRYKVLVYICLIVAVFAGLGKYYLTPKTYKASSLLIYQLRKVNPAKMAPDLQAKTKDIVSTLMQQVTSRTNLEKIIKDFSLYQGLRSEFPLEDVIDVMKTKIKINPTEGDIFQVSFEGPSPKKVLKVTNALSSKFIEENLRYREEKASETSEYLKNELVLAKKNIDGKEELMRDFKLRFYNEMPEQRAVNVSMLSSMQVKLQGVQENIQELERTKIILMEQYETKQKNIMEDTLVLNEEGGKQTKRHGQEEMDPQLRVLRLQSYLQVLQVKYKENHPEIKKIRAEIKALTKSIQGVNYVEGQEEGSDSYSVDVSKLTTRLDQEKELRLTDIKLNIAALNKEQQQLKKKIEQISTWISNTPIREAEWSSLTRDYNELKIHYDHLVSQNLQAESVENLERKQKGSQFKIMDPARLPEKPFKPDFSKIMIVALGLGLGLSILLILCFDFVDTSFRDPAEVEDYLGISVACTVPYVYTKKEMRMQFIRSVSWYGSLVIGIGVLGAILFLLWRRGVLVL